ALESRVRENRLHGSEGGAANARPYPYPPITNALRRRRDVEVNDLQRGREIKRCGRCHGFVERFSSERVFKKE
ncbi:MAG: hypothetical protein L0387_42280, partial [Acidobacteria bacterium]|nr:hypothetical protein [Acidobacteriota bacterium]